MQFFFSQDLQSGNPGSSRRTSFSSNASDNDHPRQRGAEPAYSFIGMHCIFDQCKASGNYSSSTSLNWLYCSSHKVELCKRNSDEHNLQLRLWSLGTWVLIYLHMGHQMEPWRYARCQNLLQSWQNWKATPKMSQVGLAGIVSVVFPYSFFCGIFATTLVYRLVDVRVDYDRQRVEIWFKTRGVIWVFLESCYGSAGVCAPPPQSSQKKKKEGRKGREIRCILNTVKLLVATPSLTD